MEVGKGLGVDDIAALNALSTSKDNLLTILQLLASSF
jgi:hypothetical protein